MSGASRMKAWCKVNDDTLVNIIATITLVVFGVIIAIVFIVIVDAAVDSMNDVCGDPLSVACKVAQVEECKALEKYSEDQCIALIGGGWKP